MSSWGSLDQANNAPKSKGVIDASFINYANVYTHTGGLFSPSNPATSNGTVFTVNSFSTGSGYNNADIITVVAAAPAVTYANATYTMVTNATGYIQQVGAVSRGSFSANAATANFSIANATGGTAAGNSSVTGFSVNFASSVRGDILYGNTTVNAFQNLVAVGVFAVDATEVRAQRANSSVRKAITGGWIERRNGTGGIIAVGYTGTATGYSNTDKLTIASPAAGGNASVTITTNSTGGSLALNITANGYGFLAVNATANIVATNATGGTITGTGATFSATAGGRAGRVQYESLVAMHIKSENPADNAVFPNS